MYDRRKHERLVKCEKKEIYNDCEILVRMGKLEELLKKSNERMSILEEEIKLLKSKNYRKRKYKKNIEVKNIKQKKILEYGFKEENYIFKKI